MRRGLVYMKEGLYVTGDGKGETEEVLNIGGL